MGMKVSFSCRKIFLHIGIKFNGTVASFTILPPIALTAPHHSESDVVDQNSCCYSIIKFIDFCEGVILFTMESVY